MKGKINKDRISEGDFKNIEMNILRGNVGKRYLFMLYVLLHKNDATDWAGRPLNERKFNQLTKHHIFPKNELRERVDDEIMINHLGNLTFIDQNVNEELQNRLPEDLEKHFIPTEKQLWRMDNYSMFIDKRMDLLWSKCCEVLELK